MLWKQFILSQKQLFAYGVPNCITGILFFNVCLSFAQVLCISVVVKVH